MELQRHADQCLPERKGQKRKLEEEFEEDRQISGEAREAMLSDVKEQVSILESTFSWKESDRAAAKRATHALADLAKNEEVVNVIVEGGAIPSLVKHLQAPPLDGNDSVPNPLPIEHEVEKGSAFALGLLAVKEIVKETLKPGYPIFTMSFTQIPINMTVL